MKIRSPAASGTVSVCGEPLRLRALTVQEVGGLLEELGPELGGILDRFVSVGPSGKYGARDEDGWDLAIAYLGVASRACASAISQASDASISIEQAALLPAGKTLEAVAVVSRLTQTQVSIADFWILFFAATHRHSDFVTGHRH